MELIKDILKGYTAESHNVDSVIEIFTKRFEAKYAELEANILKYKLSIFDNIEERDFTDAFYYFNKMNETRKELVRLAEFKQYLNIAKSAE